MSESIIEDAVAWAAVVVLCVMFAPFLAYNLVVINL